MYYVFSNILDFFFPRFCVHCKSKLTSDTNFLCKDCFSSLTVINVNELEEEFKNKFSHSKNIDSIFSLYRFEQKSPFQSLIHALKYREKFNIGLFLGTKTALAFANQHNVNEIDLIIPMPIHKSKHAQRGYNQSYYIAKSFAKGINKPLIEDAVIRITHNDSQTHHTIIERKENILGAFFVKKPDLIKDKNVIIIDDIITTGATINECAKVIKNSGAKSIVAVSAGFTKLHLA